MLNLPDPQWVELSGKDTSGQDLLGLRTSAQTVGNHMLNGITSVTKRVRYVSLQPWLLYVYERRGMPDSEKSFNKALKSFESAFARLNIEFDPSTAGIVGSDGARKASKSQDEDAEQLDVQSYTKNTAFSIYSSSAQDLLLTAPGGDSTLPVAYTSSFGLELAQLIEASFSDYPFDLWVDPDSDVSIALADINTYQDVLSVEHIPEAECDYILNLIVPNEQTLQCMSDVSDGGGHKRRVSTYGFILELALVLTKPPNESDVFKEVVCANPQTSDEFVQTVWLLRHPESK